MVLDTSEATQSYVEDCEVCCRPLLIRFEVVEEQIVAFSVEPS